MSIAVDPRIEAQLRERAEAEGITIDAYLGSLMREDDAEIAHTESLMIEAAESGDYIELTAEEWDRIQLEALAEVESRRAQRE